MVGGTDALVFDTEPIVGETIAMVAGYPSNCRHAPTCPIR